MAKAPCIQVPSPQQIRDKLFPEGVITSIPLPSAWTAQLLLTPFGGLSNSPIAPGDQLVIGNLTYDATNPAERLMRISLYLLESLQYYDFLFRTSGEQTEWWWLTSDPDN